MSYSSVHETSDLRTYAFKEGARGPAGRVALQRCLRPQTLPDPFGQLPPRTCPSDSRESRVWLAGGAQRHPRVRREGSRSPRSWLLASQRGPLSLRREWGRVPTADAPPPPPRVRQRGHLLDAFDGRLSELRGRYNRKK